MDGRIDRVELPRHPCPRILSTPGAGGDRTPSTNTPMRVAALYDIHGNLPALEAVLADVRAEDVDHIVIGGDVLPGPMPDACLSVLDALDVPVSYIAGNGEGDVVALGRGGDLSRVPAAFHPVIEWCRNELSGAHLRAVASWPMTLELDIAGLGRVLFCHATPRDDNELFTEITPEERIRSVFDEPGVPLVVCGHTHMHFDRSVGDTRVINAGSVGMPFGEPGAYWAMLGPGVELRRTEYDLTDAAERLANADYPRVAPFDVHNPPGAEEMRAVFEAAAMR